MKTSAWLFTACALAACASEAPRALPVCTQSPRSASDRCQVDGGAAVDAVADVTAGDATAADARPGDDRPSPSADGPSWEAVCPRPREGFPGGPECAPTFAQTNPMPCNICTMCAYRTHRCEGYDVWNYGFAYGESRGCVYDPMTGALVGARWGSDYPVYAGCLYVGWGVALTLPRACFRADLPPVCSSDGGRD